MNPQNFYRSFRHACTQKGNLSVEEFCTNTSKSTKLTSISRFKRHKSGSAAVEFALISIPFFALTFAIIETGLIFWSGQVLETAVATAARDVFTGKLTSDFAAENTPPGQQAQQFKDKICAEVTGLFNCQTDVAVDVRSFTDFQTVALPPLSQNGEINGGAFGFNQGAGGSIVVVRAAMGYKIFTGFMTGASNLNNSRKLIVATAAFQNEPF
jgi:Flp pilus assembly protein TadG